MVTLTCKYYTSSIPAAPAPRREHMKRSPSLLKLSRDHHTALSLALHIEKANDAVALAAVAVRLAKIFPGELEPHFLEEEQSLLPQLRQVGEVALVERTLQEHQQLRSLAERVADGKTTRLKEFGQLLQAHVRFEERELFMVAQRVLPGEYLETHGQQSAPLASPGAD